MYLIGTVLFGAEAAKLQFLLSSDPKVDEVRIKRRGSPTYSGFDIHTEHSFGSKSMQSGMTMSLAYERSVPVGKGLE